MKKNILTIFGLVLIVCSLQVMAHGKETFAQAEELINDKNLKTDYPSCNKTKNFL